jgi:hypothetical protein
VSCLQRIVSSSNKKDKALATAWITNDTSGGGGGGRGHTHGNDYEGEGEIQKVGETYVHSTTTTTSGNRSSSAPVATPIDRHASKRAPAVDIDFNREMSMLMNLHMVRTRFICCVTFCLH